MNQIIITGRIVNEVTLKTVGGNIPLANITVAVDRDYKDKSGEKISDFFDVTVWRQQAEFITTYGNKGDLIGVVGKLQKRSYEVDGQKRYATEIIAKEVEILSRKEKENKNSINENQTTVVSVHKLANEEDMPF